jgi:hypothetical protein
MNPIRSVAQYFFEKELQETGPAFTFARLCTSRHLEDLQWLAFFMLILVLGAIGIMVYGFRTDTLAQNGAIATALGAAAAAVLNWTYQSGSRRIGAVDLFAHEISLTHRGRGCASPSRAGAAEPNFRKAP